MPFRSVLIVICSLLLLQTAYSAEIQREFEVQPGKQLSLDLKTGADVRIEGWDKPVVRIEGYVTGKDPDRHEVHVEQTSKGIELTTRYTGTRRSYNSDGEFEIHVPSRFNVEIDSMGGGVTIRNVEGEIQGTTMGGELELSELKGRISLSTMGGDVTLTRSDLDGNVSTMGGEVLLEEVRGNVKGSSMGGKVIRNKSGRTATEEVRMSTMGGQLNVDDAPAGAFLDTMGGDIHIVSARSHAIAKTMGGDIRIDAVDGWVKAETMGGDIEVKMIGDPSTGKRDVELVSLGGDIELAVPEQLSMIIDVELAYTRDKSGRYSIQSDFPLTVKETENWENKYGSPRRYILGTGTIGTGAHRILIRTINGNVTLKKSK